jgi:hypothetical protein
MLIIYFTATINEGENLGCASSWVQASQLSARFYPNFRGDSKGLQTL